MIDLHSHILPGIDDGAADKAASLEMLERAKAAGISKIAATSHYSSEYERSYSAAFEEMEEAARNTGIQLLRGCEYSLTSFASLDLKKLTPLGDSKYVLFDMNQNFIPPTMFELLFRVKLSGFKPLIAHPERMRDKQELAPLLEKLGENNICIQVNSGSIVGKYGREAQDNAFAILSQGACHLVANDAHDPNGFHFAHCAEMLKKKYGEHNANLLMKLNPARVLENRELEDMDKEESFMDWLFRSLREWRTPRSQE